MHLRRRLGLLLLLWAAVAGAQSAPHAADLLAKARAADAKGDHAGAATALEAARAAAPEDPTVLAELGWVYFELKDAVRAEATTRRALAHLPLRTDDPFRRDPTTLLRGAALYNLGQILEGNGDKAGAVAAYVDSLETRPNPVVAKQLRALDAAAADAHDPLRPTAMEGPFPTIDAFCRKVAAPGTTIGGEDADCRCGELLDPAGRKAPAEVAAFQRHGCADGTDQELDIAVKRGDGWFVTRVGTGALDDSSGHCGQADFQLAGVSTPLPGITLVEYRSQGSCYHLANDWGWDNRLAVAIGVGTSGKPSATTAISLRLVDDDGGNHKHGGNVSLRWTLAWAKDAMLTITGTIAKDALLLGGDLRGPHHLVFP